MRNREYYEYEKENRLWTFMEKDEEEWYYQETLNRILSNPRWYLDNLDYLINFRVSFIDYHDNRKAKKRVKISKLYK